MNRHYIARGGRTVLAVALVLFSHPALTATIVVDETTCTLVDALTAANTDTAAGGCSSGSGADTISLAADVTLTAVDNNFLGDATGLPVVVTDITVDGAGHTVERDAGAPPFRLLAIHSSGTLTLNEVKLRGGSAPYQGGAIANAGTLDLTNSAVTGNQAGFVGGGIWNEDTLGLTDSTVSDNAAGDVGGGIASNETVVLTRSTLTGNTATSFGGGILALDGTVTLTNSTLSGNSAGSGGGIYSLVGEMELTHSTVSGNDATYGGGIFSDFVAPSMTGTIVANSSGGNCSLPGVVDGGANFADDASCGAGFGALDGLDPALADNGGPTATHALLAGSPALDAAACALPTDQRGQGRSDDACDAGSYEFRCGVTIGWEKTGTQVYFIPETSAFDLVTGNLAELHADGDFSRAVCLGTFTTSPAVDPLPKPEPGEGRYYLARGASSCVGAGYGDSSLVPDPRDALDGAPCP